MEEIGQVRVHEMLFCTVGQRKLGKKTTLILAWPPSESWTWKLRYTVLFQMKAKRPVVSHKIIKLLEILHKNNKQKTNTTTKTKNKQKTKQKHTHKKTTLACMSYTAKTKILHFSVDPEAHFKSIFKWPSKVNPYSVAYGEQFES